MWCNCSIPDWKSKGTVLLPFLVEQFFSTNQSPKYLLNVVNSISKNIILSETIQTRLFRDATGFAISGAYLCIGSENRKHLIFDNIQRLLRLQHQFLAL